MSSRDTSTERRLLTRLLEHEEQDSVLEQALPQDAQAAQALLDSLLEQAEPQDAEEVRLSSKFKTHRTKRGGGPRPPRNKRWIKQLIRLAQEEEEEQAGQQAEPMSTLSLAECLGQSRADRPSPDLARVPFPERIHWHPFRGPRQIWIPWPRRIAANNDEYNELFEIACYVRKYGAGCKPKRAVRAVQ